MPGLKSDDKRLRSASASAADRELPVGCAGPVCHEIEQARRELAALRRAQAALKAAAEAGHEALDAKRKEVLNLQLLGREADHRLLNGVQLVASLLAMQARRTTSAEAAVELQVASRRVATIGSLHRRLHGMDGEAVVELTAYLKSICGEIAEMLDLEAGAASISFSGAGLEIPRAIAITLGLICAELLTNAAKYAAGDIAVRLQDVGDHRYALSVTDQGPGLPQPFNPAAAKGLGMKIITSLVKDIAGELVIGPGEQGRGARFTVLFSAAA